jgi:exosortase/archaeosortase family protein
VVWRGHEEDLLMLMARRHGENTILRMKPTESVCGYPAPSATREGSRRWFSSRWFFCVLLLAAGWPVLRWHATRMGDGGDEPLGLLALGLALALTPRAAWRGEISNAASLVSGALALAAALGAGWLPMLARAVLLAAALGVALEGRTPGRLVAGRKDKEERERIGGGALGRAGLLVLSLPVMATLQFYAGYPLRVLTAEAGRPLIALFGVATERAGVALTWAGGVVVVDAPCSGVNMLWTGGVLACALAAWLRLGAARTSVLGAVALAAILAGNTVRAAVLFFIESGLRPAPGWAHEGIGLAVFGALAAGVWRFARRLARKNRSRSLTRSRSLFSRRKTEVEMGLDCERRSDERTRTSKRTRTIFSGVAAMCMFAALWPLTGLAAGRGTRGGGAAGAGAEVFPGWPEMFEGRPLIRRVRAREAPAFASGFSGTTGVFEQDGRLVVIRWIRSASRGVHPAADCFRAGGYAVTPGGLARDEAGVLWAEFTAARAGGERWRVRERWRDEHGGAWTDVSAWYWAAARNDAGGPWWAETVAMPE